jgi:hypothetical protein
MIAGSRRRKEKAQRERAVVSVGDAEGGSS